MYTVYVIIAKVPPKHVYYLFGYFNCKETGGKRRAIIAHYRGEAQMVEFPAWLQETITFALHVLRDIISACGANSLLAMMLRSLGTSS
jgi:hypothetical protein